MEVKCYLREHVDANLPSVIREFIERIMEQSLQQLNHNLVYVNDEDKADVIVDINVSRGNPSMNVIPAFDDNTNKCYILACASIRTASLPIWLLPHLLYVFKTNIILSCTVCKVIFTIYKFIGLITLQDMLNLYAGANYYLTEYMNGKEPDKAEILSRFETIIEGDNNDKIRLFAAFVDPYKVYQLYLKKRDYIMGFVQESEADRANNNTNNSNGDNSKGNSN